MTRRHRQRETAPALQRLRKTRCRAGNYRTPWPGRRAASPTRVRRSRRPRSRGRRAAREPGRCRSRRRTTGPTGARPGTAPRGSSTPRWPPRPLPARRRAARGGAGVKRIQWPQVVKARMWERAVMIPHVLPARRYSRGEGGGPIQQPFRVLPGSAMAIEATGATGRAWRMRVARLTAGRSAGWRRTADPRVPPGRPGRPGPAPARCAGWARAGGVRSAGCPGCRPRRGLGVPRWWGRASPGTSRWHRPGAGRRRPR